MNGLTTKGTPNSARNAVVVRLVGTLMRMIMKENEQCRYCDLPLDPDDVYLCCGLIERDILGERVLALRKAMIKACKITGRANMKIIHKPEAMAKIIDNALQEDLCQIKKWSFT